MYLKISVINRFFNPKEGLKMLLFAPHWLAPHLLEDGAGCLLGGTLGHNTRAIAAYNPCKNKNLNSRTSYQQQHCYFITKKKGLTCPLILFQKHLVKQLREWRASGEKIVLFMDHNEHVIEGQLGKALADKDGLDLQEAVLSYTGASPGEIFFWSLCPIDGLWVSSDLDISNVCVMSFDFVVGYHCAFILDIPLESLVGVNLVKIVHPASRRLNSRLPECREAYVASLESNIDQH
jgi:hypothetical protein